LTDHCSNFYSKNYRTSMAFSVHLSRPLSIAADFKTSIGKTMSFYLPNIPITGSSAHWPGPAPSSVSKCPQLAHGRRIMTSEQM
jgi:hypothetical protein